MRQRTTMTPIKSDKSKHATTATTTRKLKRLAEGRISVRNRTRSLAEVEVEAVRLSCGDPRTPRSQAHPSGPPYKGALRNVAVTSAELE